MVELEEYEALRCRPPGRPVMYQRWRDLLFLHVTADPADVASLLPAGLEIDTFPVDGVERAWIGLVPFRMEGVRPIGVPAAPWLSAFPETNLRTYVHHRGKLPGIWFFSLDAARWLACRTARATFGLPYFHSRMTTTRMENEVAYWSRRIEKPPGEIAIRARVEEDLERAEPGTLEYFLIERYLLYSLRRGRLWTAKVSHPPYPLRDAKVVSLEQSLTQTCGLAWGPPEHVCFSEGVNVEVFPPVVLGGAAALP